MYSLAWGEEGVIHAIESAYSVVAPPFPNKQWLIECPCSSFLLPAVLVMRDEIETTLRLLGVTKISQLGPHLLNTRAIDPLIAQSVQVGEDEKGFY